MRQISCSWCHGLNDETQQTCGHCGHHAQRPRSECTCKECQVERFADDLFDLLERRARAGTLAGVQGRTRTRRGMQFYVDHCVSCDGELIDGEDRCPRCGYDNGVPF